MKICKFKGCDSNHKAKGYCQKHYRRLQRHGDVNHVEAEVGFNNKQHPLYTTWCGMKERCNREAHGAYKYYGGRGIRVCEKWSKSFQAFISDMGDKPTPAHTLDRVDNDGDYSPDNCQWVTMAEQISKQGLRCTNKTGVKGINPHSGGYRIRSKGVYVGHTTTLEKAIKMLNEYKRGNTHEAR